MSSAVRSALAPTGVLRAGINMSNFLLVSSHGPAGEPRGLSPGLAAALAEKLGVPLQLVEYPNPGALGDAAEKNEWDVGLIGAEPQRAKTIVFSPHYAELRATYLVPLGSSVDAITQVDRPGVRIAAVARGAYTLWLEANLRHAELRQPAETGLPASLALFRDEGLDVLAGLRPWLLDRAAELPGSKVLDGHFTSVNQAIGVPRCAHADSAAIEFIEQFVREALSGGTVARLVEEHGGTGRISVPRS